MVLPMQQDAILSIEAIKQAMQLPLQLPLRSINR